MTYLSKDCDVCKGTGKDPKKRKQSCLDAHCHAGKVNTIDEMCDCKCHEIPGTIHFQECCAFSCELRRDIESDPNYNPPETETVPDLGDLLSQNAQQELDKQEDKLLLEIIETLAQRPDSDGRGG